MPDVNQQAATSGSRRAADVDTARVMDAIRRLVRALRSSSEVSRRDFGVSMAQLFVLRQLAMTPGCSLGDLAHRTRTAQSSVSEVVARLERRALISRRAATRDRRRVELALTSRGCALLEGTGVTVQERLLEALDRMGSEERLALADGIETWLAESGLEGVPPTMFHER